MMKALGSVTLVALSFLGFACSANVGPAPEENVSTVGEQLCSNVNGVNAVLASLAVAVGKELHRWNAPVDFQWNASNGQLALSATGLARCGGSCPNVQALLDMQKQEAYQQVKFPDGTVLNPYSLRAVLKDGFDRQTRCNAGTGEYVGNSCWVEDHDLWFNHSAHGTCAADYFFWVNKSGSSKQVDHPERLKFQLNFVNLYNNEFLNFHQTGGDIIIDPTVGLTEGDDTSSGSCAAACTQYSSTSLTGSCCSCGGVVKSFSRSPYSANMYLCR